MRVSNDRGLTLIEVIVGLALMGTLLTVVLIGGSKHLRQLKAAEHKRVSVRLLDEFLTNWSENGFSVEHIPEAVRRSNLPATGQFGTHGVESSSESNSLPYRVNLARSNKSTLAKGTRVRLTVSRPDSLGKRTATAWAEVIVPNE